MVLSVVSQLSAVHGQCCVVSQLSAVHGQCCAWWEPEEMNVSCRGTNVFPGQKLLSYRTLFFLSAFLFNISFVWLPNGTLFPMGPGQK